ncbi:unnamed protein product [Allacma fusca]|uniref:Actin-related protein 8 n=1 Tax=Allacma fusca TaxID=39272 RepID=A0A8J2L4S5_9HEXA|nr:unnamed protein product [Allacma fusca]
MTESVNPHVQALQASTILVFHPGSRNLRFGRASDAQPETIIHAIARRRNHGQSGTSCSKNIHHDSLIPLGARKIISKFPPEVESARLQLCHTLQTSLKTDGSPRYATPSQQIAAYNKRSKIEIISEDIPARKDFNGRSFVVGDDVFDVDSNEFNIHFPWRRGQPNIHEGIGGSISSVFTDLEVIWSSCIAEKLDIPIKDLKHYKAVVIVPVMFDRVHAREMLNLVLNRLGFGMAFLLQDHVSATFGCGLAAATVVDVGDQKISVSCVEDGISFPQSRIELKYGGGDLTLALWNLLSQCAVPFNIDLTCPWDVNFLAAMKEKFCHFDLNRCGPEEQTILWNKPGDIVKSYNILLGDELLVVPLSFFNPDLLKGSVSSHSVVVTQRAFTQTHLSDDPFDAVFISETSRRGLKEAEGDVEDDFIDENKDHENSIEKTNKIDTDQLLGIEQAILQSIESCSFNEELKRRMYSSVLIVGGGFKFKGLGPWLQNKISMNTPRIFKTDPQEVITQPKDGDSALTCWKGAAILSCLETAHELWIKQSEWITCGSRVLRERSLSGLL